MLQWQKGFNIPDATGDLLDEEAFGKYKLTLKLVTYIITHYSGFLHSPDGHLTHSRLLKVKPILNHKITACQGPDCGCYNT